MSDIDQMAQDQREGKIVTKFWSAVELVELAVKMRDAQKRYFRTRTRSDLVAAKNLEVEFDQKAGNSGADSQS